MGARGGIDLGGTKIQAVIVAEDNSVLGSARRPTPTTGGPADVAKAMTDALTEGAEQAGLAIGDLQGVGVGSPGTIDSSAGTVSGASNLPAWSGTYSLGPELARALGVEVHLGNDVQVATEAEFELGAGRPFQSLLGVFWGTGVGGGLILEGRRWVGRGAAGEIGHMVVKKDGARCPCGRRGCLEAYAGRAAMELRARHEIEHGASDGLLRIMRSRDRTRLTSGVWERALKAEDSLAIKLIDRAIEALGAGIASAVNLLDVEAVIIGGGLGVRFGAPFSERIAAAMRPHLFVDEHPPAVRVAELGDLGGAIGAALLATQGAPAPV
ncbi:MAG TPA: ROK family protein [Solirubrobacteraceae bacterium]|nr:ROK family protein [Solirubrobacteraceae bacterium]